MNYSSTAGMKCSITISTYEGGYLMKMCAGLSDEVELNAKLLLIQGPHDDQLSCPLRVNLRSVC